MSLRAAGKIKETEINRFFYLVDIVSGQKNPGGYFFGGDGLVVDYAVVMRRLPESFLMRTLLAEDKLKPRQIEALVTLLHTFYEKAKVFKDGRFGSREKVTDFYLNPGRDWR